MEEVGKKFLKKMSEKYHMTLMISERSCFANLNYKFLALFYIVGTMTIGFGQ
jgi:hypothetical protein